MKKVSGIGTRSQEPQDKGKPVCIFTVHLETHRIILFQIVDTDKVNKYLLEQVAKHPSYLCDKQAVAYAQGI